MNEASKKQKNILIIDDEVDMTKSLALALELEGFSVFVTHNGYEGLTYAFKHHPDVILLDIAMPELNGIELLKKLREDAWGRGARVIVMSAYGNSNSVSGIIEDENFEYITKTQTPLVEFVEKVKALVTVK